MHIFPAANCRDQEKVAESVAAELVKCRKASAIIQMREPFRIHWTELSTIRDQIFLRLPFAAGIE